MCCVLCVVGVWVVCCVVCVVECGMRAVWGVACVVWDVRCGVCEVMCGVESASLCKLPSACSLLHLLVTLTL